MTEATNRLVADRDHDVVRYGVIGTGMMGCEHIANIGALNGVALTAICDPHEPSLAQARIAAVNAANANNLAEEAPAPAEFSDDRALIDSGLCDAVVIATPNHRHVTPLLDAMAAGLHVLVEKPLCTTLDDCRVVVEASSSHDAVAWVGLEYRYMPPVARLVQEVRAGTVGELKMVSIREHRFPFFEKVDDWNRFSANTGGTLVEKCCHYFDLMNLLVGERPTRVYASGGQDVNHLDEFYDGQRSDILDNAFVIVDYANGVRGLVDLCMFADATKNQEEVVAVGDAGKIESMLPGSTIRVGRRGEHWVGNVDEETVVDSKIKHTGGHHGASYLEHLGFLEAIQTGGEPAVSLEDGMWAVAVGVAAHKSIEQGCAVEVTVDA